MEPAFDEDKWNDIVAQWEADDNADAADQLASDKDAYDLAQPKTWAEQDLANAPMVGTSGMNAPPPDSTAVLKPKPDDEKPSTAPPSVDGRGSPNPAGMAAPAPSPLEPSKMNWSQLEGALRNAQLRSMQTRAASNMFENVAPGYRPDMSWGDMQVALAKQPLELAKEKQGMEARQVSMDAQKRAAGVKDAMDNPNSMQSQKAREAFKGFFGNGTLPPGFDNWSANDVQKWVSTGTAVRAANEKNADDAAKAKAAAEKVEREATAAKLKGDFDREQFEESKRHNKQTEGAAWLAAGKRDEKQANDDAQKLAKETGGDPARIKATLDRIDTAIAGKSDIPGIGAIEGRLPDILTSNEGLSIRNDAKAMADALLRMQSGAGVSDRERQSMYKLYGIDGGDERSFRDGLARLRAALAAELKAKQAGFTPETVETYHGRGGTTPKDVETPPIPPPAPAAEEERVIDGRTYRKKNGKWVTDA